MAVLGKPINERSGQMIVLQKRAPFAEAQIGGDQRGLVLVSLLHEGKEESDLNRFGLYISDLINEQTVAGYVSFENLLLGMVGHGLIQFVDQLGEQDVAAGVAPANGMDEEAASQACLAAAGGTEPDDVTVCGDVFKAVI